MDDGCWEVDRGHAHDNDRKELMAKSLIPVIDYSTDIAQLQRLTPSGMRPTRLAAGLIILQLNWGRVVHFSLQRSRLACPSVPSSLASLASKRSAKNTTWHVHHLFITSFITHGTYRARHYDRNRKRSES
ncbi:hypothetical protein PVAR5_8454 [Paecilomyces variotii No. 5]|uniref:Uncharacterized protein n=1 Tax=Byssochlamys spectabilis (strain No. 5 / NBRC 109023) TaxID=1356009 RepID=V5FNW7_BYSSN|nr:hypothetical protein PVAR5_8454 [Paecilomyces variotii No. 5]